MTATSRCDTCSAIEKLKPQTLSEVLIFLSPPVELLQVLERWNVQKPLPPAIAAWVNKWESVRSASPFPAIDDVKTASPDFKQGTLLNAGAKYD